MKTLFILLCCLFCNNIADAQINITAKKKAKSENTINLYYTPQWYFNKLGVFNDGSYPDVISAKNTRGYVVGFDYEHIFKTHFIVNVGVQYGRQQHNVGVTYRSLDFFDTINKESLSHTNNASDYKANVGYVGMKFMVGYRWAIPASMLTGWRLDAKAGFSFRISTTESSETTVWRIGYYRTDSTLYLTQFGQDVVAFGKKSRLGSMAWSHNADLYLGLNKDVDWSFIKCFSIGLSATYGIGGKYKGIGNVNSVTYNFAKEVISEDEYRSQDFSLGIRLAVGLWR